jgi:hypothetical protein
LIKISAQFENEFCTIARLQALAEGLEFSQLKYDIVPVILPLQLPDGTMDSVLGMSFAVGFPTGAGKDHAIRMGLVEDPFSVPMIEHRLKKALHDLSDDIDGARADRARKGTAGA